MSPKEIGDLIADALDRKRVSQEDAADQLGIGQSTVSRIVRGEFKRMPSELPRLCAFLGVDLPEIGGRPQADSRGIIPRSAILGQRDFRIFAAAEGGPGEIILSSEPIDVDLRPGPVLHVKDAYGIVITGNSMVPEFKPGETAIVNPLLPIVGDEVYIFFAEREGTARATIKQLRRQTEREWLVSQHNPPPRKPKDFTLPRGEWRWAHRVVGKYGRR